MAQKMIAIENKGAGPMWVAGAMIPAGEVRHFAEADLPPDYLAPPVEAEPPEPDALAVLLEGKVADVLAALPGLTDEELVRAAALETDAERPRKGVLDGLNAALLGRAAGRADGDQAGGESGGEAGGEGA